MDLPPLFFGVFLGIFLFTMIKVVQQTRVIWKRIKRRWNVYLLLIWVEAIVNLVFALTTFLYLNMVIQGSFAYYFGAVTLWAIQTQLLSQIIANRVALIMVDKRKARFLKLGLLVAIGIVNIAVYAIWIPAHMPSATSSQVLLNNIFERIEKSFFLVVDLGLNFFFLYMVHYQLIANGLSKYRRLFKFNAAIVVVSVSMDVLLLGMLSLPNPYDYVQFAPVAYIIKLHIELTMAVLISKVVRSGSSADRVDYEYSRDRHTTNRTYLDSQVSAPAGSRRYNHELGRVKTAISSGTSNERILPSHDGEEGQDKRIMKTVTTVVHSESGEESGEGHQREVKRVTGDFMPS